MKNNGAWAKVAFLSIVTILVFRVAVGLFQVDQAWPESGQSAALLAMERSMIRHECKPEMETWSSSDANAGEYLFQVENTFCKENYFLAGWHVTDATATALFRCDMEDRFAEYAVSIYRDPQNVPDRVNCQYVVRSDQADKGLGQNFAIDEPSPLRPTNAYDNSLVLFSDLEN